MEKEKFAQLVWEARDTMYRVAKTILMNDADCEDAVSQAIVNAFAGLSSLKKEEYAKTWLIRIEIHECCRIYRMRKNEKSYEEYQEAACGYGPSPKQQEEYEELYLALQELSKEMRVALVLHYLDGYSVREIAKIQRTTEGTVKSRLSRGRQKLKKLLTQGERGNAYEGYGNRKFD